MLHIPISEEDKRKISLCIGQGHVTFAFEVMQLINTSSKIFTEYEPDLFVIEEKNEILWDQIPEKALEYIISKFANIQKTLFIIDGSNIILQGDSSNLRDSSAYRCK
ncbi:hypothetical protein RF11_10894 [Thelohanellus kitauei]|uniref:Uncharacterized protein n=1 Tax=Thelohanellus kitauei TaxID=669202 RepID=A0A0C2MJK7_THEKT|nr:hypothetical protein RF11_10894 [Thelohanellus kitauei]